MLVWKTGHAFWVPMAPSLYDIIIKIVEVRGEGIRIGIDALRSVEIQRGEVADALAAATIEVANDGHDGEALQNAALRLLVAG